MCESVNERLAKRISTLTHQPISKFLIFTHAFSSAILLAFYFLFRKCWIADNELLRSGALFPNPFF